MSRSSEDALSEDFESCGHDDREQRPCCTADGNIVNLCDDCYGIRHDAGQIDYERDAEVFGYAN